MRGSRQIRADADQQLTNTAAWTNLNSFTGHGGKVLFYNGVSHPWFSAWDTLDYWRRAEQANGPAWADSSRFYMVPGMGHCGGGMNSYDSFDLLGAVVDRVGMRIPRPASSVASRFEVKSLSSGSPHPQPGISLPISRHRYRPAQRLRGIDHLIPCAEIQEQRSSLEAMARCWSERINFR